MKVTVPLFASLALFALASCNAPYGNGVQQMVPQADVEAVERQEAVTPAAGGGLDAYSATQYGLNNRYGSFHGYGRPAYY